MNKEELKTIVAQMLREMHGGEQPEPAVKDRRSRRRRLALGSGKKNYRGITVI